jgi:hypothetical protein
MPKTDDIMKMQNLRDEFFKKTFSNVEVARDFIENYLPESILKIIDLETLELQKDSFINEPLTDNLSGVLFQASRKAPVLAKTRVQGTQGDGCFVGFDS